MKKVIAVVISVLATVLVANAELNEVRGITVENKAPKRGYIFHFCNTNPFEVYVDAELRCYKYLDENNKDVYEDHIVEFRSFLLKPNETYIWNSLLLYAGYVRYKAYTKSSQ